jgi:hypothetical protein
MRYPALLVFQQSSDVYSVIILFVKQWKFKQLHVKEDYEHEIYK